MEGIKVYEYVTVGAEWFGGQLDKGTRLYYDFTKVGYIYHYEFNQITKNDKYESNSEETIDYFISLTVAEKQLRLGNLVPGPEIGMFETLKKDDK